MVDKFLIAQLLDATPEQREDTYRQAERDHGKGFADHLRDQVESQSNGEERWQAPQAMSR